MLLAVPDDAIEAVATRLAAEGGVSAGKVALHLSGRLGQDALAPLVALGVSPGSFHPLQTVAEPRVAPARLWGAFAALEGDALAIAAGRQLARSLGMRPVELATAGKALYHAGAVMVANYTVTLVGVAERLARDAGVTPALAGQIYLPLLRGALENLEDLGPALSLTGPVRRGDAGTVRGHLAALGKDDRLLYAALGHAALSLATKAGLDTERARDVRRALDG